MVTDKPLVISAPEPRTLELIFTPEARARLEAGYTVVETDAAAIGGLDPACWRGRATSSASRRCRARPSRRWRSSAASSTSRATCSTTCPTTCCSRAASTRSTHRRGLRRAGGRARPRPGARPRARHHRRRPRVPRGPRALGRRRQRRRPADLGLGGRPRRLRRPRPGARPAARRLPRPRLRAFDPWLPPSMLREAGVEPADLDTVLGESDTVFVVAAVTSENRGFLGADAFARMRPGAALILLSRADVVDFEALMAAVRSGRIVAASDVFPEEPLPRRPPGAAASGLPALGASRRRARRRLQAHGRHGARGHGAPRPRPAAAALQARRARDRRPHALAAGDDELTPRARFPA